ncbi:MAG: dicarboxylate/amino acid:cation symporter [Simkaniaceae bacterium]|nr:dicarboxylate/amino acid:cation symporter [Simkaniaceae bacterium]MCF7852829.1 dicarboxylate/amino acid:cation symporter [Simkaniaceae bacterium]
MSAQDKAGRRIWWVLFAIVLGVALGSFLYSFGQDYIPRIEPVLSIGGKLFLNALTLIVVPLVSSSIINGMSRIGTEKHFSTLGLKMFVFYLGTSFIAILIGVSLTNLIQPGSFHSAIDMQQGISQEMQNLAAEHTGGGIWANVRNIISNLIPSNVVNAFAQNDMLGLIFFSIIFGYAVSQIPKDQSNAVSQFFRGVFSTMLKFTRIIMKALPLGVFFLVTEAFMKSGLDALRSVGMFVLVVLLALSLYAFVALPLLLFFVGRVNPWWHVKAMVPAIFTAFSTSSSSATMPVTMECVEKRARVSNMITSLVIPLGGSINMAGSALYEAVAAIFIAQVYGIEIGFVSQIVVIFLALLTSIGVAGIPSASLVVVIIILKTLGLPAEAVGLIIAVDRLLDMCRTSVNVFSDSCCAILVAKTEGEKKVLAQDPATLEDEV